MLVFTSFSFSSGLSFFCISSERKLNSVFRCFSSSNSHLFSSGFMKNSNSPIWNSLDLNKKSLGAISFLKHLPIWAIPNGKLCLVVWFINLKSKSINERSNQCGSMFQRFVDMFPILQKIIYYIKNIDENTYPNLE